MNQIIQKFISSANQSILGKDKEIKLALTCFLSGGHLLIEDVPGMGKTTFAKTLSRLLDLSFARIQFTNDLMPSDLVGIQIFDNGSGKFKLVPGPIFNQFILADELNRGSPKTQSALLEAMEEKQVTLDGESLELASPFFVVATQNPRNQIGTHNLPESQLDRFMMKIKLGYPATDYEREIISTDTHTNHLKHLDPIFNANDFAQINNEISAITIAPSAVQFVLDILAKSRQDFSLQGLSPRAGRDIVKAAKTWAYIDGRKFVLPDDIKECAPYIISHRLSKSQGQAIEDDLEIARRLINSTAID